MSAIKHAPATPLPWDWETIPGFQSARLGEPGYIAKVNQDDEYKIHAANAYPKLVEALRENLRTYGPNWEAGERAIALLRSLGEES